MRKRRLRIEDSLLAPFTTFLSTSFQIGTAARCLSEIQIMLRTLRKIRGLNKRLLERLGQIVFQILFVFQADRETYGPFAHQRGCALLCRVSAAVQ
jgi:hypothetical protein